MGDEPDDGSRKMTLFYYGATVKQAIEISREDSILCPLLSAIKKEKEWLEQTRKKSPGYYQTLLEGSTLEEISERLARAALEKSKQQYIDQVTLVYKPSLALLALRDKEPKIVLGFELDNPKTAGLRIPEQLYLDDLVEVIITHDALPNAREILDAFKQYKPRFLQEKK